jgi:type VI secretion system secreted protein Hcp
MSSSASGNPIFVSIEGSSQGLITEGAFTPDSVGNIYQEGHENESYVKSVSHDILIARDPKSGLPTGQRSHQPLVIVKLVDKSSPLLYNAIAKTETLTKVEIKWYRTGYDGKIENYFTTTLEDAIIVDITSEINVEGVPIEKISFSYRKILWRHEKASTSGEDDWRTGLTVA